MKRANSRDSSAVNHFDGLPPIEKYRIVISRLEHEHELTNTRMKWLLSFQGFLFAGIAVLEGSQDPFIDPLLFLNILPIIGIVSAVSVLIGVVASGFARRSLKAFWKETKVEGFPNLSPSPIGSRLGLIPGVVVPGILICAWLFFLISSNMKVCN